MAGIGPALGQPVITQQPQPCTSIAGTTATFTVTATGTLPLAYQWQWGVFGNFYDRTDCTNTTLVLTNVGSGDAVDYRVIVTNVDGAITSAVATLIVLLPPTNVKVTPTNSSVSLGANLTMRVTASGTPPLGYQWCLNRAPLSGRTSATMNLTNVQMPNAGAYAVVVTNLAGSVTSSVVTLEVDPTFTKVTTGDVVAGVNGNGAAWGDLDNDGYLDLVVLPPGSRPLMYHNNHDGTFSKQAAIALTLMSAYGGSVCALGDFENNGDLDLLIGALPTAVSGNQVALFKNNGQAAFTDVTETAGVFFGSAGFPFAASCVDCDNDGRLDLFIGDTAGAGGCVLLHNNGDGTFRAAPSAGLTSLGHGVGGDAWADYDNDGYPDLFIGASNPGGNVLYHNNGDGTFTPVTGSPIPSAPGTALGCAWADYDNSGFPSLFVANGNITTSRHVNSLYHNEGNGTFKQVTQGSLVTTPLNTLGCAWGDYDNDGFLDLLVINGGISGSPLTTNALYHNNGDGTFSPVSLGSLTSDLGAFGCGGWADYDNDGFLDLFVANLSGNSVLYHNNGNSNGWVVVRCVGQVSNRSGIGAKVRAKAFYRGASRWQLREIFGGDGVGHTQPLLAHFGLGDATNIDTLRIEWPSGIAQELYNLAPRQSLTITEPVLTVPWRKRTVLPGTSVTLSVSSQLTNALGSQWQLNGSNLPGQTNQTLVLASAGLANAGQYRLAIQTSTGLVLSPAANLVVLAQQPQLVALPMTSGYFALQVSAGVTPGLLIQASTNLIDWVPVLTNRSTNTPLIFSDTATGRYPRRFYRTFTP